MNDTPTDTHDGQTLDRGGLRQRFRDILAAPDENNAIARRQALRVELRAPGPISRLRAELNDPLCDTGFVTRAADADTDEAALQIVGQEHPELLTTDEAPDQPPLVARTDWAGDPPPREWLIPEWLVAGRVALLTGRAGRGKSWLTAHLAAAVAAGRPCWLPTGTKMPDNDTPAPHLVEADPADAVLASWEDEADELHRRLLAIGHGGIGARLHHLDMAGRGPLWAEDTNTAVGDELRAYCEKHRARLLVVDPLAGAFAGDEIARASVRYFMSDWDAWGRRTKCTVVMIGHPPKSDDDYSGSTDWLAAARGLLVLSRVKQETNTKGKPTGRIVDDHHGEDLPGSVYRLAVRKSSYGRLPADRLYLRRTDKGTWETSAEPKAGTAETPDDDDVLPDGLEWPQ